MQRFVSPNFCPVNKQNGVRVVRYVADGCARTERKKERKKEISRSCCQRERILRTKKNDTHARATVASSLVDCTRTSSSSFARPGFLLLLLLLSLDMMTSEQQQRKVRYFNVVLWLNFFCCILAENFFFVFFFSVVFFEFFFFCLGGENTHTL